MTFQPAAIATQFTSQVMTLPQFRTLRPFNHHPSACRHNWIPCDLSGYVLRLTATSDLSQWHCDPSENDPPACSLSRSRCIISVYHLSAASAAGSATTPHLRPFSMLPQPKMQRTLRIRSFVVEPQPVVLQPPRIRPFALNHSRRHYVTSNTTLRHTRCRGAATPQLTRPTCTHIRVAATPHATTLTPVPAVGARDSSYYDPLTCNLIRLLCDPPEYDPPESDHSQWLC